jgi:hypothetical protein
LLQDFDFYYPLGPTIEVQTGVSDLSQGFTTTSEKYGLSFSPLLHTSYIKDCRLTPLNYRCLLRVLCPVKRPITTPDCVLLEESSLVLEVGLEFAINFRIFLRVLINCLKAIFLM